MVQHCSGQHEGQQIGCVMMTGNSVWRWGWAAHEGTAVHGMGVHSSEQQESNSAAIDLAIGGHVLSPLARPGRPSARFSRETATFGTWRLDLAGDGQILPRRT